LNAGTFDSGISIVSFVRGLRPVRAARVCSSIDELDALWDKAKEILKADNSAINGGN